MTTGAEVIAFVETEEEQIAMLQSQTAAQMNIATIKVKLSPSTVIFTINGSTITHHLIDGEEVTLNIVGSLDATPAALPAPPMGCSYIVNAGGKYLLNADGAYILAKV